MDKHIRMLLLKALKEDGNIDNIEKIGYQYASIAKEYSRLINERMIVVNDNLEFVLSTDGILELERLIDEIKEKNDWRIEPFVKYKTRKMGKFDIFIE